MCSSRRSRASSGSHTSTIDPSASSIIACTPSSGSGVPNVVVVPFASVISMYLPLPTNSATALGGTGSPAAR